MKRTRLQTGVVIALLFCLRTGPLAAAKWATLPINVIVDNRGLTSITDGDFGRIRTRNALNSTAGWNGAGLGTVINATIGSVAGFSTGDGIIMLNFRDPVGACSGSCITATFFSYSSPGIFSDADLVTNNKFAWASAGEACSNELYVEGIMVHEFGHVLGLGHSTVPGATMYPSFGYCNNAPATIEQADRDALNALY